MEDLEVLGAPISKGSEQKIVLKKQNDVQLMFERISQSNLVSHSLFSLEKCLS